ncbi:MAG: ankyrin repeat domain-containing protein [Tatlockia sp.]|nr:ankyrin repeat domain-containing protein [Tatlockia sp.]
MLIVIDPEAEPGEDTIIENLIEEIDNLKPVGNQEIVLVDKELSARVLNRIFNTAIINGLGEIVEKLSKIAEVYKILDMKDAIDAAAQKGKLQIMKFLYSILPKGAVPDDSNMLPKDVSPDGSTILAKDAVPDDSTILPKGAVPDGSDALCLAAQNGYLKIVKFLIKVPKVDPSALDNGALLAASEHKHQNVVEYLASQPCYDPFAGGIEPKRKNDLIRLLTNFGATKQRNSHHIGHNLHLFFACSEMKLDIDIRNKILLTALELDYKSTSTSFKL